jgi:AcrR family transcriptional regulator
MPSTKRTVPSKRTTAARGAAQPTRAGAAKGVAPAAVEPSEPVRLSRREQRRSQSRDEILEAARQVLLRNGIARTTLDAVAREVGVSKAALYYYFPSKDALFFELVFGNLASQASAVRDAVDATSSGADALGAIIRESVKSFAPRLDDFRLAFLHAQVAGQGAVHFDEQQFARIRPLNDLWFGGAVKKLAEERRKRPGRAKVEPRMLAFLAWLAAVGLLTMKGMVENLDDPLLYSDEQLVEGFARVFAAAAAP